MDFDEEYMMAYVLRDGRSILTEEMIEEWGEAADRGEFPPGEWEWIVKPPGRPRLSSNEE